MHNRHEANLDRVSAHLRGDAVNQSPLTCSAYVDGRIEASRKDTKAAAEHHDSQSLVD